jgi:hypothetical protein
VGAGAAGLSHLARLLHVRAVVHRPPAQAHVPARPPCAFRPAARSGRERPDHLREPRAVVPVPAARGHAGRDVPALLRQVPPGLRPHVGAGRRHHPQSAEAGLRTRGPLQQPVGLAPDAGRREQHPVRPASLGAGVQGRAAPATLAPGDRGQVAHARQQAPGPLRRTGIRAGAVAVGHLGRCCLRGARAGRHLDGAHREPAGPQHRPTPRPFHRGRAQVATHLAGRAGRAPRGAAGRRDRGTLALRGPHAELPAPARRSPLPRDRPDAPTGGALDGADRSDRAAGRHLRPRERQQVRRDRRHHPGHPQRIARLLRTRGALRPGLAERRRGHRTRSGALRGLERCRRRSDRTGAGREPARTTPRPRADRQRACQSSFRSVSSPSL